jgi:hypothetical protein
MDTVKLMHDDSLSKNFNDDTSEKEKKRMDVGKRQKQVELNKLLEAIKFPTLSPQCCHLTTEQCFNCPKEVRELSRIEVANDAFDARLQLPCGQSCGVCAKETESFFCP